MRMSSQLTFIPAFDCWKYYLVSPFQQSCNFIFDKLGSLVNFCLSREISSLRLCHNPLFLIFEEGQNKDAPLHQVSLTWIKPQEILDLYWQHMVTKMRL